MPLSVTIHDDGKHFTLDESIFYYNGTDLIIVPEDFVTDFASIPRFLWSIYPPTGRYQRAAVIHDWLYICHYSNRSPLFYSTIDKNKRVNLPKEPYNDRKYCDDLFLSVMKQDGVSARTRYTLYSSVRMFAGGLWKNGIYKGAV